MNTFAYFFWILLCFGYAGPTVVPRTGAEGTGFYADAQAPRAPQAPEALGGNGAVAKIASEDEATAESGEFGMALSFGVS